jgi:hypothetical protein
MMWWQELEGDRLAEGEIVGAVDLTHTAAAERGDNAIPPGQHRTGNEPLARHRRVGGRVRAGHVRPRLRRLVGHLADPGEVAESVPRQPTDRNGTVDCFPVGSKSSMIVLPSPSELVPLGVISSRLVSASTRLRLCATYPLRTVDMGASVHKTWRKRGNCDGGRPCGSPSRPTVGSVMICGPREVKQSVEPSGGRKGGYSMATLLLVQTPVPTDAVRQHLPSGNVVDHRSSRSPET